jgi:hypothetical protein
MFSQWEEFLKLQNGKTHGRVAAVGIRAKGANPLHAANLYAMPPSWSMTMYSSRHASVTRVTLGHNISLSGHDMLAILAQETRNVQLG